MSTLLIVGCYPVASWINELFRHIIISFISYIWSFVTLISFMLLKGLKKATQFVSYINHITWNEKDQLTRKGFMFPKPKGNYEEMVNLYIAFK